MARVTRPHDPPQRRNFGMRLSPIIAAGSCKKFTVWRGHRIRGASSTGKKGVRLMTDIAMRYLSTMNALSSVKKHG
jgi:hypothetical protein